MKNRGTTLVIILSLIVLIITTTVTFIHFLQRPKIAYVRSHELVERYSGTIEARTSFEKKKSSMLANVDSLKIDFERNRNQYMMDMGKMSVSSRTDQEKVLGQRQDQIIQYSEVIDQKILEEDEKMMQEVLNQINSFIEEYAIEEGYTLVLGTTLSGSLLYGEKSMDITEELIENLNKKYSGK